MPTSELADRHGNIITIDGFPCQVIGATNHIELLRNHAACTCCSAPRKDFFQKACDYCRTPLPRLIKLTAERNDRNVIAEPYPYIRFPSFGMPDQEHITSSRSMDMFGYSIAIRDAYVRTAGATSLAVLEYDASVTEILVAPEVVSFGSIQAATIVTSRYSDQQPTNATQSYIGQLVIAPGGRALLANTEIDTLMIGPGAEVVLSDQTTVHMLRSIDGTHDQQGAVTIGTTEIINASEFRDHTERLINHVQSVYGHVKEAMDNVF